MDKNDIAKAAQLLETKEDLLLLLNKIKQDEMADFLDNERFIDSTEKEE